MHIAIRAEGSPLTVPLLAHLEQRLVHAIGAFPPIVSRLDIGVASTLGARGRSRARCLVVVHLTDRARVMIKEAATDVYLAVNRALARIVSVLRRRSREAYPGARGSGLATKPAREALRLRPTVRAAIR